MNGCACPLLMFSPVLCEMVTDQATARIDKEKIPYIPECEDYVEEFYLTAAAQRNRNHVQDKVEFRNCSFATEEILYDPQTSGGLLASVDKEDVPAIMEELEKLGLPCGVVGEILPMSSYGDGTESSGIVRIIKDLDDSIIGENVLIVEDIIDSGRTLSYLVENLKSRGAKTVRLCTLMSKPSRRVVDVPVDYIGYEIPDEFVVGYGLDYAQRYRNLPYVGVVEFE